MNAERTNALVDNVTLIYRTIPFFSLHWGFELMHSAHTNMSLTELHNSFPDLMKFIVLASHKLSDFQPF